jgi:nucleotide-binding universal stress UspA family protein
MKTVFCPVDFSWDSTLAAEWAAMISIRRKKKLVLFNKFPVSTKEHIEKYKDTGNILSGSKQEAEERLKSLESHLGEKFRNELPDLEIQTDMGIELDDLILRSASGDQADLIVMSTEGAETFQEILFGSNTSNVIKHARIPVLVIPPNSAPVVPETILFATDLKDENAMNIGLVADFASDFNSRIIFTYIITGNEHIDLSYFSNKVMSVLPKKTIRKLSDNIKFEIIRSTTVYDGLYDYSRSSMADLIVLERHPKNFLSFLFKGDLTRLMTLYPFLPLLILYKNYDEYPEEESFII